MDKPSGVKRSAPVAFRTIRAILVLDLGLAESISDGTR
jgi:hypothetical protein